MQFSYNKYDKLKSKKLIKKLFDDGKAISVFPLRLIYLKMEHEGKFLLQTGVSVSKRNFKLAVHRNRIKRMMREVYRLNKNTLYQSLDEKHLFMFIYLGKSEIDYNKLNDKMKTLIETFISKTINHE